MHKKLTPLYTEYPTGETETNPLFEAAAAGLSKGFHFGLWTGASEGIYPKGTGDVITEGAGKVLDNANFAQKTYKSSFSIEGQKIYSDIAGVPIETVDDLTNALKKGLIKPSDVPIDYIVRDGNVLILNTRSSHALMQAGIPRSQWNAVNRTGIEMYENMLNNQLKNNGLTSAGISTAKRSGGR